MTMQAKPTLGVKVLRVILPRSVRNAVRKPGTSVERIVSKCRRLLGSVAETEVLPGWWVRSHPMCAGEFRVFRRDPRQETEMRCFAHLATEGMRFVDVGTHWGVFTLAALHFGGSSAQVLGVEASGAASRVYRDNLRINRVEDRVIVVNAACGDRIGEIEMLTTGAGGADYFVIPTGERSDTITVPVVSLDDLVKRFQFRATHLKIDVEGYEEEVLKGARQMLEESRPLLFLELHGDLIRRRGRRPEGVLEELCAAGYSEWRSLDDELLGVERVEADGFNARFVARHHRAAATTS